MSSTEYVSASKGWSLLEALQRAADPDLWRCYLAAKAAYEKVCIRTPAGPGAYIEQSAATKSEAKATLDAAFSLVKSSVWQYVRDERLVARGSRGGVSLPPAQISSLGWGSLGVKSWDASRMFERGDKTVIHNVRLFPLVYDEDAPVRLVGLTLAEAFRKCVLEDPEVVSRGTLVMKRGRDQAVFGEGQYPGPFIDFKWPLGQAAHYLAFAFVHTPIWILGDPIPQATPDIIAAANAISDRLSGLQQLLASGRLIAWGTFADTGQEVPISPRQWSRTEICIDARNSDFFDRYDMKTAPKWTGIVLAAPSQMQQAIRLPNVIAEEAVSPTPVANRRGVERVESLAASQTGCAAWLVEEMGKSPTRRIGTKDHWWRKAKEKWPGSLSHNAFNASWAEAIRTAKAPAWGAAGAPRKSPNGTITESI